MAGALCGPGHSRCLRMPNVPIPADTDDMTQQAQQRILEDPVSPSLLGVISAVEVICGIGASNRTEVLALLANSLAKSARIPVDTVFTALMKREELGSTGVGRGIGLPHAWIPRCPKVVAAFGRLAKPIDWGAVDGTPVDVVFALVGPHEQPSICLSALSIASRLLRQPGMLERLRGCQDPATVLASLKAKT